MSENEMSEEEWEARRLSWVHEGCQGDERSYELGWTSARTFYGRVNHRQQERIAELEKALDTEEKSLCNWRSVAKLKEQGVSELSKRIAELEFAVGLARELIDAKPALPVETVTVPAESMRALMVAVDGVKL